MHLNLEMNDMDKAEELSSKYRCSECGSSCSNIKAAVIEMAELKEQEIIDKACDYLKQNVTYIHPRKGTKTCVVNLGEFRGAIGSNNKAERDKTPVPSEIIDNIIKYCEDEAIYDKLGRYGDFYYKLKQLKGK